MLLAAVCIGALRVLRVRIARAVQVSSDARARLTLPRDDRPILIAALFIVAILFAGTAYTRERFGSARSSRRPICCSN